MSFTLDLYGTFKLLFLFLLTESYIYIFSLYIKLLQFNPAERLGAGVAGVEDIKSHPFFALIEWADLVKWEMRSPSEQTQVKWTSFSGPEQHRLSSLGCPKSLDILTEGRWTNHAKSEHF